MYFMNYRTTYEFINPTMLDMFADLLHVLVMEKRKKDGSKNICDYNKRRHLKN